MISTRGKWSTQPAQIGIRIVHGQAVYFAEIPGTGQPLWRQHFATIEDALRHLELDSRLSRTVRDELLAQAHFLSGMATDHIPDIWLP